MTTALPDTTEHDIMPPALRRVLPYCLLALAVLAVYGTIFENAFLFDDDLLIQLNNNLRGWGHIPAILTGSTTSGAMIAGGFYRPMQMLLYLIAFQLGGGSTVGFHFLNLAIHIGNACFAYRLGTKLGFKPSGVFLAVLVWAVHPLHTEAVTYMSATADPLFAFFCLWAVVALVPDITQAKIYKVIPLFLLGILSKETAVMLPLLVMVCLFLTHEGRLKPRTYLRTWPLWLITLGYVAWRRQAPGFDGPQTYARLYQLHSFATLKLYADHFSYRLYTFFATLPAYLKLLAWPTGLHMERAFAVFTIATCPTCDILGPVITGMLMCVAAVTVIVWGSVQAQRGDKSWLPMAWGFLWFIAAHGPDTGILIPMNSLFLEHWMYLPSIGLFLGIAETLARFLERQGRFLTITVCTAVAAFALAMANATQVQNAVWHDPGSFYTNIFAYGEKSARAHNNLALWYSDKGDYDLAVEQFKQAIEISDSYAETRHNLALTYLRMENQRAHVQAAIDNLNHAISLDPNFYRSYLTLGDVYAALGDATNAKYYRDRGEQIIAQRRQ